jgi:hypothetical protein
MVGGVLLTPSIMGTPFHKHLFDVNPLLEQQLVLDLLGAIKECNSVGTLDSATNPGQEGRSRCSIGNIDVRGMPLQKQFGRTGSKLGVHINGVFPNWAREFGSAPSARRISTKSSWSRCQRSMHGAMALRPLGSI